MILNLSRASYQTYGRGVSPLEREGVLRVLVNAAIDLRYAGIDPTPEKVARRANSKLESLGESVLRVRAIKGEVNS